MIPGVKKRFWKNAEVSESGAGYGILLDGKSVKTPAKSDFLVPHRALAEAIAVEWRAQGEKLDPEIMPMTRRANAAIDKVAVQHGEVAAMLSAYGGNDLLCYRASYPLELAERQSQAWDPLLTWAETKFQARLQTTVGIMPVQQDDDMTARLGREVQQLKSFPLTGFHDLVTLSGSLVIGLAAVHEQQPIETLWQHSCIDENWQAEHWGADDEALKTAAKKRQEFLDAWAFYQHCQNPTEKSTV